MNSTKMLRPGPVDFVFTSARLSFASADVFFVAERVILRAMASSADRLSDNPECTSPDPGDTVNQRLQSRTKAPEKSAICSFALHKSASWKSKSTITSVFSIFLCLTRSLHFCRKRAARDPVYTSAFPTTNLLCLLRLPGICDCLPGFSLPSYGPRSA